MVPGPAERGSRPRFRQRVELRVARPSTNLFTAIFPAIIAPARILARGTAVFQLPDGPSRRNHTIILFGAPRSVFRNSSRSPRPAARIPRCDRIQRNGSEIREWIAEVLEQLVLLLVPLLVAIHR
jgi:hypothetical protein